MNGEFMFPAWLVELVIAGKVSGMSTSKGPTLLVQTAVEEESVLPNDWIVKLPNSMLRTMSDAEFNEEYEAEAEPPKAQVLRRDEIPPMRTPTEKM
jgi:hypothetical protein